MFRQALLGGVILVGLLATNGSASGQVHENELIQQRVVERLAERGISLADKALTLRVTIDQQKAVIKLISVSTGEEVASATVAVQAADVDAAATRLVEAAVALLREDEPEAAPPTRTGPPGQTSVPVDPILERRDAEAQYGREFIGFEQRSATHVNRSVFDDQAIPTTRTVTISTAFRGINERHPLSPDEFYRAVGRPDLAKTYTERARRKKTATWISAAFAVTSTASAAAYLFTRYDPEYHDCWDAADFEACLNVHRVREARRKADADSLSNKFLAVAGVTLAVSLVSGGIALTIKPHPVSNAEARRLADEHNRQLRRRLGLERTTTLKVSPFVTPGGGGLSLSGLF